MNFPKLACLKNKMKKVLPFLAAFVFLISPTPCFADYVIQLKNNAHFRTGNYWKKGNLVYFRAYGGIVGIEKNDIKSIKESSHLQPEDSIPLNNSKPSLENAQSKSLPPTESAPLPSKKIENDRKYMPEFVLLTKQFIDVEFMETQELYQFANDLTQFRNKILAKRLGHLYTDQFVEIYAMGDKVEAILKERPQ